MKTRSILGKRRRGEGNGKGKGKRKKLYAITDFFSPVSGGDPVSEQLHGQVKPLIEENPAVDDQPSAKRSETKMMELAEKLMDDGVITIPLFSADETEEYRKKLLRETRRAPEFNNSNNENSENFDPVNSAFGALGNPSSFHNTIVRKIRILYAKVIIALVKCIHQLYGTNYYLSFFADRFCIRRKGTKTNPESFHKDSTSGYINLSDLIAGGWINFDKVPQYFSCVLGTHKEPRGETGFAKITDKKKIAELKAKSQLIEVLPGHAIVFFQNITHNVYSKTIKGRDSVKLFTGFALTESDRPLFDEYQETLVNQGVPVLPSGAPAKMYYSAKWMYTKQRTRLSEWSQETFNEACLTQRTVGSGAHKGETYTVVHQQMKSLTEYGFPLYPAYDDDELSLYAPGDVRDQELAVNELLQNVFVN